MIIASLIGTTDANLQLELLLYVILWKDMHSPLTMSPYSSLSSCNSAICRLFLIRLPQTLAVYSRSWLCPAPIPLEESLGRNTVKGNRWPEGKRNSYGMFTGGTIVCLGLLRVCHLVWKVGSLVFYFFIDRRIIIYLSYIYYYPDAES